MPDKLNIASSRSKEHNGLLLDLLVDNATRLSKELYRRVMANKRTEVMLSISEREGGYYLQLSAGPLVSEEAVFLLFADLIENKEQTLKEFKAHGSSIQDETSAEGS